jgi:hypothetical protein
MIEKTGVFILSSGSGGGDGGVRKSCLSLGMSLGISIFLSISKKASSAMCCRGNSTMRKVGNVGSICSNCRGVIRVLRVKLINVKSNFNKSSGRMTDIEKYGCGIKISNLF